MCLRNKGLATGAISLDLKKASDTINYNLIKKLNKCGTSGNGALSVKDISPTGRIS